MGNEVAGPLSLNCNLKTYIYGVPNFRKYSLFNKVGDLFEKVPVIVIVLDLELSC